MIRATLSFVLLLLACEPSAAKKPSIPEGIEPGQRMPAFAPAATRFSADGTASTLTLSSRNHARPTAYVFVGTQCPTTAMYLGRLAALEKAYDGKIDFAYIYPNSTDPSEEKLAFHKKHKLRGPMIDDKGAKLATSLGGERTAELVLADKKGIIVYRGAIDDNKDEASVTRKHFALAVDEHLAGKPVSQPKTIGTA